MSKRKCVVAFADSEQLVISHSGASASQLISKAELPSYVAKHRLISAPTCCILPAECYQFFLADQPGARKGTIEEALLWQEEARFDVSVDQVALEFRAVESKSSKQQLLVASAKKAALQAYYDFLDLSGLIVKEMLVPEDCYQRYLTKKYPSEKNTVLIREYRDLSQALVFNNAELVNVLRLPKVVGGDFSQLVESVRASLEKHMGPSDQMLWLIEAEEGKGQALQATIEGVGIANVEFLELDTPHPKNPAAVSVSLEVTYGR